MAGHSLVTVDIWSDFAYSRADDPKCHDMSHVSQNIEDRSDSTSRTHRSQSTPSWRSPASSATEDNEFESMLSQDSMHVDLSCMFSFADCNFHFIDLDAWKEHVSAVHIRRQVLPDVLDCFQCQAFSATGGRRATAWDQILDHTASCHHGFQSLRRPRSQHSILEILIERRHLDPILVPGQFLEDNQHPTHCKDISDLTPRASSFQESNQYNVDSAAQGTCLSLIDDEVIKERPMQNQISEDPAAQNFDVASSCSEEDSESDEEDKASREEDQIAYIMQCLYAMSTKDLEDAVLDEQEIVRQIMSSEELWRAIPTKPSSIWSCTGTTSSGSSQGGESRASPSREKRISSRDSGDGVSPRRQDRGDDDDDDPGDGDDDGKQQRPGPPNSTKPILWSPLFACPFFKHNPTKYQSWTGCPGPGWKEVHRLKSHIYTKHLRPELCVRCGQLFKTSEELTEHQRGETECELRPEAKADGIDAKQIAALKSKKRINRSDSISTEEEKWNHVYSIIFPHDSPIPSPYYEPSRSKGVGSGSGEKFQNREYFNRLYRMVQETVSKNRSRVTEELIPEILNNVRELNADTARQIIDPAATETADSQASEIGEVPPSPAGIHIATVNTEENNRTQFPRQINPALEIVPRGPTTQSALQALPSVGFDSPFIRYGNSMEGRNVSFDHSPVVSAGPGSSLSSRRNTSISNISRRVARTSMTSFTDDPLSGGASSVFSPLDTPIRSSWLSQQEGLGQPGDIGVDFSLSQGPQAGQPSGENYATERSHHLTQSPVFTQPWQSRGDQPSHGFPDFNAMSGNEPAGSVGAYGVGPQQFTNTHMPFAAQPTYQHNPLVWSSTGGEPTMLLPQPNNNRPITRGSGEQNISKSRKRRHVS